MDFSKIIKTLEISFSLRALESCQRSQNLGEPSSPSTPQVSPTPPSYCCVLLLEILLNCGLLLATESPSCPLRPAAVALESPHIYSILTLLILKADPVSASHTKSHCRESGLAHWRFLSGSAIESHFPSTFTTGLSAQYCLLLGQLATWLSLFLNFPMMFSFRSVKACKLGCCHSNTAKKKGPPRLGVSKAEGQDPTDQGLLPSPRVPAWALRNTVPRSLPWTYFSGTGTLVRGDIMTCWQVGLGQVT